MIPDTEEAKVLIALGAAGTVFTLAIMSFPDPAALEPLKWLVYALLSTAALMLGVDYLKS